MEITQNCLQVVSVGYLAIPHCVARAVGKLHHVDVESQDLYGKAIHLFPTYPEMARLWIDNMRLSWIEIMDLSAR